MTNTHTWVIEQLECRSHHDGKKDVVFTIHWRRQAVNGRYMADAYGTEAVELDSAAPFTPYDNLTQAQVEGWLADAMGAEHLAALDSALDAQIATQIETPVVTPPLPWAG